MSLPSLPQKRLSEESRPDTERDPTHRLLISFSNASSVSACRGSGSRMSWFASQSAASSIDSTASSSSFWSIMAVVSKSITTTVAVAVAALLIASPRSQRARMYLNVALYVSSLGVCSVFGVITSIIMNLIPGQKLNINYVVARTFYYLAGTLCGWRFTVEGEENFAKARPAVLVGNHQTSVDILYLGRIFPKFASIMAKQELKLFPLLGQYMALSGAVFIDRKNRNDAVKAFNQVGAEMKRKKLSLWIFPEGTRSRLPTPDMLPFKKGAFHLAVQSQLPVVPVVCENYHRIFDNKSRFESGTIRIKVLPPISTEGLTKDDVSSLSDRVREEMLKALKQMDAERESFDTSTNASTMVPANEKGIGGLAGLIGKFIGTGSGKNYIRKAEKDESRLRQKGTTGENPKDYSLLSEADKHTQKSNRDSSASGSGGSGSEETEGSTVLVEKEN
ncbi:unnamed protein product [Sympodiomycopsis kandeliae]